MVTQPYILHPVTHMLFSPENHLKLAMAIEVATLGGKIKKAISNSRKKSIQIFSNYTVWRY